MIKIIITKLTNTINKIIKIDMLYVITKIRS